MLLSLNSKIKNFYLESFVVNVKNKIHYWLFIQENFVL